MGKINWFDVKQMVSYYVRSHQDQVLTFTGKTFTMIAIIIISFLVIRFGSMAIKKFFEKQKEFKYTLDVKRSDTLSTLCISILRYTVYFIGTVTLLQSVFNINATTIITAAGVGGLAIGFGAQGLVKDVITGFFILLEDQFSVGDVITVDGMTGNVEEMGLRITKIRHYTGDLFIIPNSEIKKVTNHTRGEKAAIVDIPVAYEENTDRVLEVLDRLCKSIGKESEFIVEGPAAQGVVNFNEAGVTMRIFAKTIAGRQVDAERMIRKKVKDTFDREGIKLSNSKMIVVQKHKDEE